MCSIYFVKNIFGFSKAKYIDGLLCFFTACIFYDKTKDKSIINAYFSFLNAYIEPIIASKSL